ncbi:MAG: tRNA uridine-5-carboxymethylaminomethyl(34) synthesis GTPase MnmE [Lachnospiraceae bacterium]|nr:tRNA uridine-5-carboxymethylaminomethyl(34) synthesis GTPase MnmE [Lachnospiraceae bacterium]
MFLSDTIAAISTGMTNSGIGIVRISGNDAFEIADKIFQSKNGSKKVSEMRSHTVHYGYIFDGETVVDEVLLTVMKAPNTYTKEDIVEINCHGGIVVVNKVLETVLTYGARPAEPGEFTKRAFLNGRIDLTQAEAVIDVINAKNSYALSNSINQLKGVVSDKIIKIREKIMENIAFIEAALDDPEHISLENYSEELIKMVRECKGELKKLIDSADNGRVINEGIRTVILGKPNAGKSSFLNSLIGEERAIVTEIEGTTRDTLEENIRIHGISLNIVDTAGIRDTEDKVEQIGVDKARKCAENADLIIYVVDSSRKLDQNDEEIIEMMKEKKSMILFNKCDLESAITVEDIKKLTEAPIVKISAKLGDGIEEFEDLLKEMFFQGKINLNDEVFLTNARQKSDISNAYQSLCMVEKSIMDEMPEDFYTIDLMNAYESLGRVVGESVEDDLVDTIFSKFCMGK